MITVACLDFLNSLVELKFDIVGFHLVTKMAMKLTPVTLITVDPCIGCFVTDGGQAMFWKFISDLLRTPLF